MARPRVNPDSVQTDRGRARRSREAVKAELAELRRAVVWAKDRFVGTKFEPAVERARLALQKESP